MKENTNINVLRNHYYHHLTIYMVNPPRVGSERGSNTFKTTYNFKEIADKEEAINVVKMFMDKGKIKKAFYNNKCIVYDNKLKNI